MYQRMPPGGMPHRQQLSKPSGNWRYKAVDTGRSGLQAGCLMAEFIGELPRRQIWRFYLCVVLLVM